MLQVSPALSDLVALGIDDPSPTITSFFDALRTEVGGALLVLSVDVGTPIDIPVGASELEIGVLIAESDRSTRFGVWFGDPPAGEELLRLAIQGTDLGTTSRLPAAALARTAPFAVQVRYAGMERAVQARFAGTGGAMSLLFEPCACGPLLLNAVRVSQLRIALSGGGIGSNKPPSETTPVDTVSTTLDLSLVASEVVLRADVTVDEAVSRVSRSTGSLSPPNFRTLGVSSSVRLEVTSVDTRGEVGDLVDRLREGGLGKRILAAMLGPFARIREGVVDGLLNWAEDTVEDQAPATDEGILVELADQLAAPILLAASNGRTDKLVFDTDALEVAADRLSFEGVVRVLPREPRLGFVAQGLGASVRVSAGTSDFRDPVFAWSSPTGGVFAGPTDERVANVTFPQGVARVVRLDVVDADGLTGFAEGTVGNALVTVVSGTAT